MACSSDARTSRVPSLQSKASSVVLSYALCRNGRDNLLKNALSATRSSTALIAHTCVADSYVSVLSWLTIRGEAHRLILNPAVVKIDHKNSPGVLGAHLSNFRLCLGPGLPCAQSDDVRFVFMSTNTVLFRPGLEEWVNTHSMSFCVGDSCTDLTMDGHTGQRAQTSASGSAWKNWRARVSKLAWTPSAPLYRLQRAAASSRDDSAITSRVEWGSFFVQLLRRLPASKPCADGGGRGPRHPMGSSSGHRRGNDACGGAGSGSIPWQWQSAPVNSMAHEGSFYPVGVLRAFVECGLPGTLFEAGLRASTGQRNDCACCDMYKQAGLTNGTTWRAPDADGSCSFVETLLPTFAWQHYSHMIRDASPPLVVRFWGALAHVSNASAAGEWLVSSSSGSRVPATILEAIVTQMRTTTPFRHCFGLKAPHHEFNHLYQSLARVRETTDHAPALVSPP